MSGLRRATGLDGYLARKDGRVNGPQGANSPSLLGLLRTCKHGSGLQPEPQAAMSNKKSAPIRGAATI